MKLLYLLLVPVLLLLTACQAAPTVQAPTSPPPTPTTAQPTAMAQPTVASIPTATPAPALTPIATAIVPPAPTTLAPAVATAPSGQATYTPAEYVVDAMAFVQGNAVGRDKVDWAALKQSVQTQMATAKTAADTYPIIRQALQKIGDRQASLSPPTTAQPLAPGKTRGMGVTIAFPERVMAIVAPGSPADRAGIKTGDVVEAINESQAASMDEAQFHQALLGGKMSLSLRRVGEAAPLKVALVENEYDANQKPVVKRLDSGVGLIDLPPVTTGGDVFAQYATLVQQGIRDTDQGGACGWVVDVRRATGGNMWPLVAGLGPVSGEGEQGAFISPGRKLPWAYQAGQARAGLQGLARVETPYQLKQAAPPLAVLTSRLTSAAGEAVVVASRGRDETRIFGEPTAGMAAVTTSQTLGDEALITITTAWMADRTGKTYEDRIAPDETVAVDWTKIGTATDPTLSAAVAWLKTQPGCGK